MVRLYGALASSTIPLIVVALLELLVHVWLAPRITPALIVLAPEPAATVMPLPATLPLSFVALRVRDAPVPAAMAEPAVLAVPAPVKFTLLMTKFASSVVLRPPTPT